MKRALLITLSLMTPAAAQEPSLVQGFAEGFTFNPHFAASRRIDPDGAVVYWRDGGSNTHIDTVRQGAAPCVFVSLSLNLNEGSAGAPVVMLEETYDLRNASFEADPKHQFAPPGGVYLSMKGPKILCRVSTGGTAGKLTRSVQCEDKFEATIEEQMTPAFKTTSEQLKALCRWK